MKRFYLSATILLFSSLGAIVFPTKWLFGPHDSVESTASQSQNNIRYYIYPEESISGKMKVMEGAMMHSPEDGGPPVCCRDALSELAVHEGLERNYLRTMDPNEADFFIVPTQVNPLISFGCTRTTHKNCTDFDESFDALLSNPIFQKDDMGKHHIIISLNYLGFNNRHRVGIPSLSRNYPRLKNVIVANRFDPMETYEILKTGRAIGHDYEEYFRRQGPLVTRSGFSVGSGLEMYLPIVTASMKRFEESQYFIFYRTRTKGSKFNSTQYRHAPLNHTEELSPSSIGYDLPKDQWLEDFTSSQFCLVIRGDSPETHAFFHSIRCGCIPVIISDFFQDFAGPFKSTLDMRDFSVMINEQTFIANPLKALAELKHIDRSVIESKVEALEYAQRVVFPDHPQSLFVPTFLKEAANAVRLADERKTDDELPY